MYKPYSNTCTRVYIYGTNKCKVMDASPKNEITGCTGTAMSWMFKRYSCLTVF